MQLDHDLDPFERLARQLDWNLLGVFIAIVQAGGISRAAEHVHLTQPAVSQALKRLEEQLDCRLIERNTRQFDVTEVGRKVYTRALEIHTQISRLGDIVATESEELFGHIRILFASRLESKVLDDLIRRFCNRYPAITLRIDVMPSVDIQGLIQQGLASAGFCLLRGQPKNIESKILMRQHFGLFCGPSHRLFGRSDLTPDSLQREDLITWPSDQIGKVLSPLTIYRDEHMYEGRVVATSSNMDEIIRLTRLGIGVGTIPLHVGQKEEQGNRLWRLPPHDGVGPIDVHLIWNPAAKVAKADQVFLEFAQSQLNARLLLGESALTAF